ncbi:hydrolase [Corynebacterium sp. 13CS0277]|uniref:zinc-dependent metalloprotease n=1 Tax=Corynebacterium sp. 13CS0277 TaxID=2071994 RepID=UPI000D02804B|nr:zinc-dependent metalloprotease [Corynebacterium sp. 13CS0277]PRQ11453.1 hydrolase [Corynebacterium sp. 13CS0277]
MSNGGFGFSFGAPRDDDDDNNDKQGNQGNNSGPFDPFSFIFGGASPFGGATGTGGRNPLEDLFGGLTGFGAPADAGESTADEDESFLPVDMVERALSTQLSRPGFETANAAPASKDAAAVQEATRLAELWLDATTPLPTAGAQATAWSVADYARGSLPFWLRLAEPARKALNSNPMLSFGEADNQQQPPMFQQLERFLRRQNQSAESTTVARSLMELATSVVSGTDLGVPAVPPTVVAIMTRTFREDIQGLDIPDQEALVYACAREAARQRLFKHVGWLTESIVSSMEEWAAGAFIDGSEAERYIREELGNISPENFQEALQRFQNIDREKLTPRLVSANENAAPRLGSLLALIEGWVDVVVTEAVADRLPHAAELRAAWKRRRDSGGTGATALEAITGAQIGTPPTDDAITLWERTTAAVGAERRDACWEHPDLMPSPEDIAHPARFIDRLLDETIDADFDPIAEIEALEKKLGSGDVDPESRENPADDGDTGATTDDK